MPKKPAPIKTFRPEPKPVEVPAPATNPNETYQVIKRNDAWVIEMTLFGKVWHDEKVYPHKHDAEKALERLQHSVK